MSSNMNGIPEDIRDEFFRPLVPDALLEDTIKALEGDAGMVSGNAAMMITRDLKKLKFICRGIANAYFSKDARLHNYMQTLVLMLNERFTNRSQNETGSTQEESTDS